MRGLLGLRAKSATRPLPRFRSCSIDITVYRRAVTEQLDTLTAAEAEGDRGVGATLGAFESCVVGGPQLNYFFLVSDKIRGVVNLKAYRAFAAQNRPDGRNACLTIAFSPAPQKAES
jgi:hypothetical protein